MAMSDSLTIKVLKGLPLARAKEHQAFKLLETFAFIKALWVDRPMPDTPAAYTELATASGRTVKTIKRRLCSLQQLEWIVRYQSRGIECISWDKLADMHGIVRKHFYHIKPSKHVHVEYILQAKAIDEKQRQCAAAFRNRVIYNPYLKAEIKEVAGSTHSETVAYHQLECFKTGGALYAAAERQLLNMHYRKKETGVLRGDIQLSNYKLKQLFGLEGHGSFTYRRRKLEALSLVHTTKRSMVIPNGIYTTTVSRLTRLGYCNWNPRTCALELIMPDKIDVLALKGLDDRLEQLQAAIRIQNGSTAAAEKQRIGLPAVVDKNNSGGQQGGPGAIAG